MYTVLILFFFGNQPHIFGVIIIIIVIHRILFIDIPFNARAAIGLI